MQRELGQEQFTRLVRYAYDRGIRFFETAESYGDMHRMLGVALEGIPRDSYRLMSKVTTHDGVDPQAEDRRAAQARQYRLLRRDAAALAAHGHVADRQPAVAGRHSGSAAETRRGRRTARRCTACRRCASFPRTMAPDRHDPHEPQGRAHGRRGLRHARPGQCERGRHARETGPPRRAWA